MTIYPSVVLKPGSEVLKPRRPVYPSAVLKPGSAVLKPRRPVRARVSQPRAKQAEPMTTLLEGFETVAPCLSFGGFEAGFSGFEAVAPCKGKGISAQGIVNAVNDTLGSPHEQGLKGIAPCKGNMSK